MVTRSIAEAQSKVEGYHFDSRKNLLEYDDVLNKQRTAVYAKRQQLVESRTAEDVAREVGVATRAYLDAILGNEGVVPTDAEPLAELQRLMAEAGVTDAAHPWPGDHATADDLRELVDHRSKDAAGDPQTLGRLLGILDQLWMSHLEDLEDLEQGVKLRGYAQRDPLLEYRREASEIYERFWFSYEEWVFMNAMKLARPGDPAASFELPQANVPAEKVLDPMFENVGRNDPCPCGSGKKFKKCHGADA
jgi:preprotein translocase subunit SecA